MFHKSQNKPDLIFKLFLSLLVFLPSTTYWLYAPTTWCIPPTKHVVWVTNAPSNFSCACFELGRLFASPPSHWELKEMSSRGPSNLNNCTILWPCVLDADLASQAFFSFFIIIPPPSCSRLDHTLCTLPAFQLQPKSLILWLRAVGLSFAFHEFLLKPFFQTLVFCNANRISAEARLLLCWYHCTSCWPKLSQGFLVVSHISMPSAVSALTLGEIFGRGPFFVWLA